MAESELIAMLERLSRSRTPEVPPIEAMSPDQQRRIGTGMLKGAHGPEAMYPASEVSRIQGLNADRISKAVPR
jgi:hypothetical protein